MFAPCNFSGTFCFFHQRGKWPFYLSTHRDWQEPWQHFKPFQWGPYVATGGGWKSLGFLKPLFQGLMLSELILHPTLPFPQGFLPLAPAQAPELQPASAVIPGFLWLISLPSWWRLCTSWWGGDGVLLDLEWVIFKKLIICIIFHVALWIVSGERIIFFGESVLFTLP